MDCSTKGDRKMKTLKQLIQLKKDEIAKKYSGLDDELSPDEILEVAEKYISQNRIIQTATNTFANIGYQQALTDLLQGLK